MKILEPQSAVLSNVEVLAHLSLHPPRRSPPTAPNVAPNPDLRDHNTVVKEFHNYVTRLSPHLLYYPPFNPPQSNLASANILNASSASSSTTSTASSSAQAHATQAKQAHARESSGQSRSQNGSQSMGPTPLDVAIRKLISELRPFGLTKAEVLTILNLGVGLKTGEAQEGAAEGAAVEDLEMGEQGQGEGEGEGEEVAGQQEQVQEEGGEQAEAEEEEPGDDYGALALLDTVIEDREERLSDDDIMEILRIIREALGGQDQEQGQQEGV